jgi:hypothetical protein
MQSLLQELRQQIAEQRDIVQQEKTAQLKQVSCSIYAISSREFGRHLTIYRHKKERRYIANLNAFQESWCKKPWN